VRASDLIGTAMRNLRRQKLRSALTIFAVVIGATSVTIMLALVTGAKDFFIAQFESTGQLQQVIVSQATDLDYDHARWANSSDTGVKLTDDLATKIAALPHVAAVARNASPYVFEAMKYGEQKLSVNNTQASDANGVVVHDLLAGRDFQPGDGTGTILIAQPYADKLGFAHRYDALVGQKVTLITRGYFTGEGATIPQPQFGPGPGSGPNNGKPPEQPPTELSATVLGVVAGDDTTLYFPLSWTHGLLENRHYDMRDGRATLVTTNELDQRGYNSLTVLRACGATRATIRRLFTLEAGLLGFLGGVFGVAVGFGLTRVANVFINQQLTASSVKAHDIISLSLWLIATVIGATTLIGVGAGLYPAVRASRLNPVEALRYE
jgi:ABC-type lipoprotein release transport system permease subunit